MQKRYCLSLARIDIEIVLFIFYSIFNIQSMFQSKRGTVSGYFLAGRFMTFLPVSFLKFNSKLIQFNTNLIDIE